MVKLKHELYNVDCLKWLKGSKRSWDVIFADPPDNLGLEYNEYEDSIPKDEYLTLLRAWVTEFVKHAPVVWVSFNSMYTIAMGNIVGDLLKEYKHLACKPCIQSFTFGCYQQQELANCHRPLWRISHRDFKFNLDAARIPSWRLLNGDKRADPRGKIPTDVFDFPRVTGNSNQRRDYHPTQLHEGLVERALLMSVHGGPAKILDPMAGTGTTLRVCKKLGHHCTLLEIDKLYCKKIGEEHGLTIGHSGSDSRNLPKVSKQRQQRTIGRSRKRASGKAVLSRHSKAGRR